MKLFLLLFRNFTLCFLLFVVFISAQGQDAFSNVFKSLKTSDFSNAYQYSESLEDDVLKAQIKELIKLISSNETDIECNFMNESQQTNLVQIVNWIGLAFCSSKKKTPDLVNAYVYFSKAIKLSAEENQGQSEFFSIFCILKLLKNEIFIGSKQHEFYLDYLKRIKQDESDNLIYTLYHVSLNSKEDLDFNSTTKNDSKIKLLDRTFLNVSDQNPFKAAYLYERGIQNKLSDNFEIALIDFRRSVDMCITIPFHQELSVKSLWQLSHTFLFLKKMDSSQYYLNQAKTKSTTIRDDFYNSRLQSWIYNESGNNELAYDLLKTSIELEYKLGAKNNSFETALLSIENETDKLRLDNVISENRRKSTLNWLVAASLVLIFGSGIAILLQKNTTKKRQLAEQETQLKQERVDNLLKNQELMSIDAMIEGQEKERQRVANELHDDLGSLMATIKLHFDNAKMSKKDPSLQNAEKLLEEAYQKVRGMAHNKNSGVMSSQGLLPAIKKMAHVITETNALAVTVEDFGMGERLENSLELSLFRMVQELVANAIKHAAASKVSIQLTQHEDNLNIIIEDNGKGFDRSKIDVGKTGMGLTTIEKRVEHLEGNFTIDSVLGKGTSILIDIPV